MKHNYKISGLSCLGCKTSVESALNEVKGVNEAIVDMATGTFMRKTDAYNFQSIIYSIISSQKHLSAQLHR